MSRSFNLRNCTVCNRVYRPTGPAARYCPKCGNARRIESQRRAILKSQIKKGVKVGVGSGGNQWGENNPQWRGGVYDHRKYRKTSCELCSNTGRLDVHHKDGNRLNNQESNLMTLCRSCHRSIHQLRRGSGKVGKKLGKRLKQLPSGIATECRLQSLSSMLNSNTDSSRR